MTPKQRMLNAYRGLPNDRPAVAPEFWYYYPAKVLGVETPRVAILSAVETVNPKINTTLEAAALCKMADRGQITGGIPMSQGETLRMESLGLSDAQIEAAYRRARRRDGHDSARARTRAGRDSIPGGIRRGSLTEKGQGAAQ